MEDFFFQPLLSLKLWLRYTNKKIRFYHISNDFCNISGGGPKTRKKSNCWTLVGFPLVSFHWISKKFRIWAILPISTTNLRSVKIWKIRWPFTPSPWVEGHFCKFCNFIRPYCHPQWLFNNNWLFKITYLRGYCLWIELAFYAKGSSSPQGTAKVTRSNEMWNNGKLVKNVVVIEKQRMSGFCHIWYLNRN